MRRPVALLAAIALLPLTTSPASSGTRASQARIQPSCFNGALPPVGAPGDIDADGIDDQHDACPDRAENRNGYDDHDGCPDERPEPRRDVGTFDDAGATAETESTTRTEVLSKEFLKRVPAGRSYQSATGMAAGVTGNGGAPPPEPAPAPQREAAGERSKNKDARASKADGGPPATPAPTTEEVAHNSRRPTPTRGSMLDWGASIFLSNDDSMSLASAQRVIYALQRGMPLPMEHIRPHELLNYFSFDVAEPSPSQLFDVSASATRDGDTLSVALAVKGAEPQGQPLDLTVLVDRSGSMRQEGRMAYTQRGLKLMADQLDDGDRLDLVTFNNTTCVPLQDYVVGRDDPRLLQWAIDNIQPNGGTNLAAGLHQAYAVQRERTDTHRRNRRVMLLTDAELNQGDVDPYTVSEIGRAFDSDGIRLTGIGVGTTFRDDVLDRLTEKGKGAYVFLGSEAVVDRVFGVGFDSLVQTIAHDVQFRLDLPESLAMERFYGEEASTDAADVQPIHYYAGTSQVFLQDLTIRKGALSDHHKVGLVVSYRDAATGEPETRTFTTTVGDLLAADSHNVDKARALMAWTDMLQLQAMGGDACGAPLHTYATRAGRLPDDAEVGFVNGLVRSVCGEFDMPVAVAAAPLKVRIDSDQPITRVGVDCGGHTSEDAISSADRVARLDAVAGTCLVTLAGVVDMKVEVEVPEVGRDLRCTVRAGRVHCG